LTLNEVVYEMCLLHYLYNYTDYVNVRKKLFKEYREYGYCDHEMIADEAKEIVLDNKKPVFTWMN